MYTKTATNYKAVFTAIRSTFRKLACITLFVSPSLAIAQSETNLYDDSNNQNTFYVAPTGNDKNDGSFDAPFKTLYKAQRAVREVNKTMTGDVVVCLRGGTYQMTSTLTLDKDDEGKDGHYVRYISYPGEHPLLTGGIPINDWTLYDESKNIWCAKGVDSRFRQLYVNGKKAVRACFPNVDNNGNHDFVRLTKVDTTGRAFDVSSDYVGDWNNFDKVEIHLMIAWSDNVLRLESKQKMGSVTKLIPRDPERTRLFKRAYPMLGVAFFSNPPKQQVFYLENAYELIDAPYEWYLDESTNTLYYKPGDGEDMSNATVVAPILNTLVSIQGEDADSKVGNIAFEGLTFAHTTFMRPSNEGFLNLQAGLYNIDVLNDYSNNKEFLGSNKYLLWRPEAGFRVENAHDIKLVGNVFSQMAATGVDFVSGTKNDRIEGNLFMDLGGTGIMIGKYSQDSLTEIHIAYNPENKEEICTNDTIKNNYIHNVTTEIQGAVGIGAGYPRDVLIEHNELAYMNYSGISVGFGWTKEQTAMDHNRINWNRIHHVSQLLCDCGPIYTLSNQGSRGEIQYNYVYDISASKYADYWVLPIYLDEGSSGFDVSHNVFDRAPDGVACNSCGNYTESDNNGHSEFTKEHAGIESQYLWLKDITSIPIPDFSEVVPEEPFADITIPGIIQLEDYDLGGQNVSYYDSNLKNEGLAYRDDAVDIVPLGGEDAPNGYAIGYTARGEWLKYTLNVDKTSAYKFRARVSSGLEGAGFKLFVDGVAITDTVSIPQGEDWDTYTHVDGSVAEITEGKHILKVEFTGGYGNVDWIEFITPDGDYTGIAEIKVEEDGVRAPICNLSGVIVGYANGRDYKSIKRASEQLQLPQGVYFVISSDGKAIKFMKM